MELFSETGDLLSIGLKEAFTESMVNFSYSPLLKQELKTKIQINRLKRGEDELKVDFEPKPRYELREEEKVRQERRKEVNRMAAVKFRKKKKNQIQNLEKKLAQLEEENKKIQAELNEFRKVHVERQLSAQVSPEVNLDDETIWILNQEPVCET